MTTRRQQCINNANVIKQSVNGKHKLALSFVCLSLLLSSTELFEAQEYNKWSIASKTYQEVEALRFIYFFSKFIDLDTSRQYVRFTLFYIILN